MVSQKSHRAYLSHQLVNLLRVSSQANEAALYTPILSQSCSTCVAKQITGMHICEQTDGWPETTGRMLPNIRRRPSLIIFSSATGKLVVAGRV